MHCFSVAVGSRENWLALFPLCVVLLKIQACQETISSLQLTKQAQERQIAVSDTQPTPSLQQPQPAGDRHDRNMKGADGIWLVLGNGLEKQSRSEWLQQLKTQVQGSSSSPSWC